MGNVMNVKSEVKTPEISNGVNAGNSLGTLTIGPAGLAAHIIYEIMALEGKIISLDQQQKVNETKARVTATDKQASATAESGKKAMLGAIIGGSIAIGMGIAAFGTQKYLGSRSGAGKEMQKINEERAPILSADKEMRSSNPISTEEGTNLANKPGVAERMKEIKAGNFKELPSRNTETPKTAKENEQELKDAIGALKAKAQNGGTTEKADLETVRTEIKSQLETTSRNLNTQASNQNGDLIGAQSISGLITTLGSSGSQAVSGGFTAAQKKQEALASVSGTASQMAGEQAGDFGQSMTKRYDAQNNEVQVLEAILRANSVN